MVVPPNASILNRISDLRSELKIPRSALVLCRHGSSTTFDIPFVLKAINRAVHLHDSKRLHFVFLGGLASDILAQLTNAPAQIHILRPTTSEVVKERYFKTCDAMIHARSEGETFGLAVAEFSVRNKLVITQSTAPPEADAHIKMLGSKALYYSDEESVLSTIDMLIADGVKPAANGSLNAYSEYEPEKVMAIFKRVFLDPIGTVTPFNQEATAATGYDTVIQA